MKHVISTRWLINLGQGGSHFPHNFWRSYVYLIYLKILVLIINAHTIHPPPLPPPYMLIVESRMVIIFCKWSPISFKHMPSWYPLLEAQTT